jgi:hypothetical protein
MAFSVFNGRPLPSPAAFLLSAALLLPACSKSVRIMPEDLPPVVKQYVHLKIWGGQDGLKKTGVHLDKGDTYSIIATGSIDYCSRGGCGYRDVRPEYGWPLIFRIGDSPYSSHNGQGMGMQSPFSGTLHIGYKSGDLFPDGNPVHPDFYRDDSGAFEVDIIVWAREDYEQIAGFLQFLLEKDPENKVLERAIMWNRSTAKIVVAATDAAREIQETRKQLDELKQPVSPAADPAGAEEVGRPLAAEAEVEATALPPGAKETSKAATPPLAKEETLQPPPAVALPPVDRKEERIAELEAKLAKLAETLAQLDQMRKQLTDEREKTTALSQELEEKEKREKELVSKLQKGGKSPPIIVIATPNEGGKVEVNVIRISGVAEDDEGIQKLKIYINNKPLQNRSGRGLTIAAAKPARRIEFDETAPLEKGVNEIKLIALDTEGLSAEKTLFLHKEESRKNVWAVVIGINAYPRVPPLKYAIHDAKAFYEYLVQENGIPRENVLLLLDKEASLSRLRSVLGTYLKNKAGKDDMVILYFAGHGATERDAMSPDADGLEKYLLPYDADPKDLYASSLPMREISHIFNRIRAERLVFLVDSCYSGASGGRTINLSGIRANISDSFLDRIAAGRGTVVMTASAANEVSVEDDSLRHGVFTYFLLEGLKGKADADADGVITVDEIYAFVSRHVTQATGQEQHPVKKGAVEGSLILGIVQTKVR